MTTEQKPVQKPAPKPAQRPAKKTAPAQPPLLQWVGRLLGGPDRPPRGTHPPRTRYRTIWEWLRAKRWTLVRLGGAAVVLLLVVGWARPLATELVEEQYSAGAVRKSRVLLRGAQIVATQQLVDFASWEETQQYLLSPENLPAIVDAGKFPVEPLAITAVTLDTAGRIDTFGCTLVYENRRYDIQIDVKADRAIPTLQAKLEPSDNDKA